MPDGIYINQSIYLGLWRTIILLTKREWHLCQWLKRVGRLPQMWVARPLPDSRTWPPCLLHLWAAVRSLLAKLM